MSGSADDFDLDDLIDEDPPPSTQRTPNSGTLVIEEKMTALFTSATWQMTASVKEQNGNVILVDESTEKAKQHSASYQKMWARQVIRLQQKYLRKLGVNVESAYLRYGGKLEDLEETG